MLSNEGKFTDRNPDLLAAGKCFALGGKAKDCLNIPIKPKTTDPVQKFHCTTQPGAGQRRIFYGRYSDPDIAVLLSHGVNTKPSFMARDLVNPRPKSLYVQRLCDRKEEMYASHKKAPLGKSHDQRVGLPKGVGPHDSCYGLRTVRDCTAGELVSPPKSQNQVNKEAEEGQELYKRSHSAYKVGETYDRKYNWSKIPKSSLFGVETPHDNRGKNVQKTLKWLHEAERAKAAPIASKRVDSFRERTQPQVGQVHDPIKDTMYARIEPDHTFGILFRPDEYGAGDLIHNRTPGNYLRGKERLRGVLGAVRQHLKKANYHNFHDLNAAFKFYDKDGSGKIDISELWEICQKFQLPVDKQLLEALFEYCDVDNDGQIDYIEFSNFLNWKDRMPAGLDLKIQNREEEVDDGNEDTTHTDQPKQLRKQIDDAVVDFKTSSQMIHAVIGGMSTEDWKKHGIPTIRSDLPAPRVRRIGDSTNYGDESNAYGLLNPSIYSNHGIHERDFFQSRDQSEMRRIFDSIGYGMTNEAFQEIWNEARSKNPEGKVSVESFRQMLDEFMANSMAMDAGETNEETRQTTLDVRPDVYKNIDTIYRKDVQKAKNNEMVTTS